MFPRACAPAPERPMASPSSIESNHRPSPALVKAHLCDGRTAMRSCLRPDAMGAVLKTSKDGKGEDRTDSVREAVERELKRREKARSA